MSYRRAIKLFGLLMAASGLALASATSVLANSPPHAPIIQSPTNGSSGVSIAPTFVWIGSDPDNDPLVYDVYIGLTPDDAALVATNITITSYAPQPLNGQTRYYWFVVARDPSGAEATSVVATFFTATGNPPPPIPVNPPNGSTAQPWTITFDWTQWDLGGGVTFDLYLGTTNPPPFWDTFTTATPTIDVAQNTHYYWLVKSRNAFGVDRYSPQWTFTTAIGHPTLLTLSSPGDQVLNQPFHVDLDWNASDADGDPLLFDVYLGPTIPPNKIASDVSATVFNVSVPTQLTRYYWQIVAKTIHGNTTGPIWSFTTRANSVPDQAFNPDPSDGGNAANPVLLTWQASDPDLPGQQLSYDIYFGTNFQPPLVTWGQTTPSYNPGPLYPGLTYYWSISVSDGINVTWGPIWSFVATDSIVSGVGDAPTVTTLGHNHPNPFNPQTIIPYGVPNSGAPVHVRLVIYDTLGRAVRTLVDEKQSSGFRDVIWKGDDQNGVPVSSGVYYCVLRAGNERRTQKLVLLK